MDKVRLKATRPSYILFAYGLMPIYISLFKFGRTNLTMEVINKNFSYGAFHKWRTRVTTLSISQKVYKHMMYNMMSQGAIGSHNNNLPITRQH